jgi:hypothetical protein
MLSIKSLQQHYNSANICSIRCHDKGKASQALNPFKTNPVYNDIYLSCLHGQSLIYSFWVLYFLLTSTMNIFIYYLWAYEFSCLFKQWEVLNLLPSKIRRLIRKIATPEILTKGIWPEGYASAWKCENERVKCHTWEYTARNNHHTFLTLGLVENECHGRLNWYLMEK